MKCAHFGAPEYVAKRADVQCNRAGSLAPMSEIGHVFSKSQW
jgi:hypothetical protein